jgi:NAD(P)-dependent dehydrogenase (short-subunit alcohol dehydrogenase family)
MSDKVAIVTAASRGMGAAVARELARRSYALAVLSTSEAIDALAHELGALTGSHVHHRPEHHHRRRYG